MDIIYRYDPTEPVQPAWCSSGDDAIQALRDGNNRHEMMVKQVQGEVLAGEHHEPIIIPSNPFSLGFTMVAGEAPVQSPYAIVLGCSDARAPIELIFDQSHNELFVIRVAGNVLGTECLGSIEYGARHFAKSVKLVAVLGHSGCGAVGAAVDLYLDPDSYGSIATTYSLRSIVDRLLVVVRVADKALQRRFGDSLVTDPGYKKALWEVAVYLNAALTATDLSRELQESTFSAMKLVYGVYSLTSKRVEALPGSDQTFAQAPKDSTELNRLGDELVEAVLARGLLARNDS